MLGQKRVNLGWLSPQSDDITPIKGSRGKYTELCKKNPLSKTSSSASHAHITCGPWTPYCSQDLLIVTEELRLHIDSLITNWSTVRISMSSSDMRPSLQQGSGSPIDPVKEQLQKLKPGCLGVPSSFFSTLAVWLTAEESTLFPESTHKTQSSLSFDPQSLYIST